MEKESKLFWGSFTSLLVFVEIGIYLSLSKNPLHWEVIRAAFIILNVSIMMYLLYTRKKKEKLEQENNQTYEVLKTS
jgi:hypothetical protein